MRVKEPGKKGAHFYIVVNAEISIELAIQTTYKFAHVNIISACAKSIRNAIKDKFEKTSELEWPPDPHKLLSSVDDIPDELFVFLKDLISPYMTDNSRDAVISSIAQDICRAATNGQWKLAKLVALGMTLFPLHRSNIYDKNY